MTDSGLSPLAQRRRRLHRLRQEKLRRQQIEDERAQAHCEHSDAKQHEFQESVALQPTPEPQQRRRVNTTVDDKKKDSFGDHDAIRVYSERIEVQRQLMPHTRHLDEHGLQPADTAAEQTNGVPLRQENVAIAIIDKNGTGLSVSQRAQLFDKKDAAPIAPSGGAKGERREAEHSGRDASDEQRSVAATSVAATATNFIISVPTIHEDDTSSFLTASTESELTHMEDNIQYQISQFNSKAVYQETRGMPNSKPFPLYTPVRDGQTTKRDVDKSSVAETKEEKHEVEEKAKSRVLHINVNTANDDANKADDLHSRPVSEFAKYFDRGGEAFVESPRGKQGKSTLVAERAKLFDPSLDEKAAQAKKVQGKSSSWSDAMAKRTARMSPKSGTVGTPKPKPSETNGPPPGCARGPDKIPTSPCSTVIAKAEWKPRVPTSPCSTVVAKGEWKPSSGKDQCKGDLEDKTVNETQTPSVGPTSVPWPGAALRASESDEVKQLRAKVTELQMTLGGAEQKSKQDAKRSMAVFASALKEIDSLRKETESLNAQLYELKRLKEAAEAAQNASETSDITVNSLGKGLPQDSSAHDLNNALKKSKKKLGRVLSRVAQQESNLLRDWAQNE